jgi:hypothetical protein
MKLLGHLDGVSPDIFPKHPYEIVNQLTLKARLGPLRFCVVRNDAHDALLSTQSEPSKGVAHSCATGECTQTSSAKETTRSPAAHGVSSARERHREALQRAELPPDAYGVYRGRAHVRNMWLSPVCCGETRRVVRARCAEHVLLQLENDPGWLAQIAPVQGPTSAPAVRAGGCLSLTEAAGGAPSAPAVVTASQGGEGGAQHTGMWATAEMAKRLPSLVALQAVRDSILDEQMSQYLSTA